MPAPTHRKWLYALIVSATALGGAEWAAGRVEAPFPAWRANDNPSVVMTGHPSRLWGLAPGERKNVETVATVHALGLRGAVPEGPRSADEQRVVVLGDSSFFGFGVADDQTMAAHLERRLDGVTVINAAIPGYSTEQSIRLMDEVVWDLDPSLLVIANFWSDTNFEPFADKDLLATADASRVGALERSALLRWLAVGVSKALPMGGGRIVTWPQGEALPEAGERRVPVKDYAANLDALIRTARSRNAGVVLFTPPSPVEIEAKVRPPHQWEPYRQAQRNIAALHGVPHVDSTAAFAAAIAHESNQGLDSWFLDDLHPTAQGQRLMAKLGVRALKARGWPSDPVLGTGGEPFDASGFVDTTPASRAGRPTGDRSPITNLFSAEAESGPEPAAAKVTLRIEGGTPPYAISLQAGGQTVASARLNKPREVKLDAPRAELNVVVTDGNGIRKTQVLSSVQRNATVSF